MLAPSSVPPTHTQQDCSQALASQLSDCRDTISCAYFSCLASWPGGSHLLENCHRFPICSTDHSSVKNSLRSLLTSLGPGEGKGHRCQHGAGSCMPYLEADISRCISRGSTTRTRVLQRWHTSGAQQPPGKHQLHGYVQEDLPSERAKVSVRQTEHSLFQDLIHTQASVLRVICKSLTS